MVELDSLVGKKVKVTRSNGTFTIGILRSFNSTHLFVFDEELNRETAEPIALVSYREAW
jgi:small nuclear ribonucleoprotein (snRNP)-like protein